MLNYTSLMGRLTRDPEFKQTQSGIPVCTFSVAVDRKFQNKQTGQRETDFIDCQAWRGTAEFISRYFNKGSMICVEGSIQNNNWTDGEGKKHYKNIVVVDQAHFCGGKSDSSQSVTEQSGTTQTDIEQFAKDVTVEPLPSEEVPF